MRHLFFFVFTIFTLTTAWGQSTGTITGTIRSASGETMPGVTIVLDDSRLGTTTDESGRYLLRNVPSGQHSLQASFVGFQTFRQTVTVNGTERLDITLTDNPSQLSEVIVSTQKRAESILDVPIAIAAVDGNFLKRQRIQELDVLSNYIPGLQVQLQSPNNPGFVIRGVTSDDGDSRAQARVSVFQDGVQISRSRGAVVELFDMERVEVAKGPQGTLFGRGAQIGAVHLIQNKARNNQSGEVLLSYGNYNSLYAQGFINQPVVKDKFFVRVAGVASQRDGFIDNISGGTLNGKGTYAGRLALRYLPGTRSTLDLLVNYQYDDYPGTSFKSGRYAPRGGTTDPNTAADLEQGTNLFTRRKVFGTTLLWNQQLTNRLTLNSISAYRWFNSHENFDADGTAAPALFLAEFANSRQWSQEFRLNYQNEGRFSGFAGVSVFSEDNAQRVPLITDERSLLALYTTVINQSVPAVPVIPIVFPDGSPNLTLTSAVLNSLLPPQVPRPLPPLKTRHEEAYANFGKNTAYEIFADGTYQLTSRLSLSAGIRGSYENQTGGYQADPAAVPSLIGLLVNNYPNILSRPTQGRYSVTKDYFSAVGRLVLDYKIGNQKAYASISRGRRPGVIQVSAIDTTLLRPEIVMSYEIGYKGATLANRLQYDLAAYFYDWNNFQSTSIVLQQGQLRALSTDAGSARSIGAEIGLRYNVFRNSLLYGSYSYIDGKFNDTDREGRQQQFAGNRFRLTPMNQVALGADLNFPVQSRFSIYFRPNYTYKSKVFFENTNQANLVQEGYGLVNLNAGVEFGSKPRVMVGFYGKNLLDQQYIIDAGNTGNAFGIPTFIAGPPRFVGAELRVSF
ncbi:TonB-dependent receptor [Fibrisoma limi BUZ 3]|uniref:TonB-dependent receptor n=1 Tax=Fibrisoma limi BUZ 3 TaxID=1185876 RepID=I2GIQ6_9BACT|nr:TonB-dependent receptor [Fibrisoma limi]CCH53781.1 TonB-dependent receptor [Fibrisoma limi BUZ 3]